MKCEFTPYERREYIKSLLIQDKHTTAVRLAYLFDVDKQTIQRDITFLSSRLPIVTKSGKGGGIFLDMKFESRKEFLTDREKNLLKKVSKTLSGEEKLLIENIINKFSIPKGE